jgi:hypothetical protein
MRRIRGTLWSCCLALFTSLFIGGTLTSFSRDPDLSYSCLYLTKPFQTAAEAGTHTWRAVTLDETYVWTDEGGCCFTPIYTPNAILAPTHPLILVSGCIVA